MSDSLIKEKLKSVPKKPGCYLWKNRHGVIIYVGKAKNLYNRTHQYFNNKKDPKTFRLVSEIYDLDYIIVNNENESLLLENNLISIHKPKYNILLRESSIFPYIVLTKEQHPKLLYVHDNKKRLKGTYYGPFAITKKYELFNFINRIFPLRKCNKLPNKKCLYYDIGQCLGPCINKIEQNNYDIYIKRINDFFSGKTNELDKILEQEELKYANELNFEMSQNYLDLRKSLKEFGDKQEVVFSKEDNEDIIGFSTKENVISISIFKYIKGNLLSKYDLTTIFYSEVNEIVETLVFDYYKNIVINRPKTVNLSLDVETLNKLSQSLNINFVNPTKGSKKEIMIQAFNNAQQLIKNKYLSIVANANREANALNQLEEILGIDNLYMIDIFDNSSLFNTNKIGVVVVYENGKKNRNLYRKFNIKNESSASDFDYMKEVIYRRYKNILKNEDNLPNLIILDGGKPQITATMDALKLLNLQDYIPVIGLAKDNKHKTDRIVKSNFEEIILDKKSDLFFFLLNMQDEVHRYAITFHRKKRKDSLFKTQLESIENLGKIRINKLIEKFETIDRIKEATIEELSQIVPVNVAKKIKENIK